MVKKPSLIAILKAFSWFSLSHVILDWYHLKKKCDSLFSLGLKGYKLTAESQTKIKQLLWYGGTDEAITSLHNKDPKWIKNQEAIDQLITYLQLSPAWNELLCWKTRNLNYAIVVILENTLLICSSQTDKNTMV